MREFDEAQKRKSRAKLLSTTGKIAEGSAAVPDNSVESEQEACLLAAALSSMLGRDPAQIIHAHVPIDEARVMLLLQD